MAAAKRVLIVSEHPYPDHATVRRNVRQLIDCGVGVDLLCLAPSDRVTVPDEAGHLLRVHALRMRHRRSGALRYVQEYVGFWLWTFALTTVLSIRHRYAAVLVDNPPDFMVFVSVLARLRGARVVLEMFELFPELTGVRLKLAQNHPVIRLSRSLEGLATRWADQVIVVSQQCHDVLVRRGVDGRKIHVIPNTPHMPVLDPRTESEGETPFVVTHCSLIERYGVQVAIEAMDRLRSRWPDLKLHVLGEGEYRPRLVQMVRELELDDRVIFRGFRPWLEAIAEIRRAQVGIVAIIADGYGELLLPTKLLEYAANGVPVACANLPTIAQHFPPDTLAYFEPGDAGALAAQIERLLRHREQARAQAAGAKLAMRSLTWEVAAPRYLAALGLAAGATT